MSSCLNYNKCLSVLIVNSVYTDAVFYNIINYKVIRYYSLLFASTVFFFLIKYRDAFKIGRRVLIGTKKNVSDDAT